MSGFSPPPLVDGEIQVWRIELGVTDAELSALARPLSAEERERAARFRFERDRRRWIAARGALRCLLGYHARTPPEQIAFRLERHGKPSLVGPAAGDLRFNLAHSGAVSLCALARGREVGVDVEAIRPDFATDEVARRFFAPAEVAGLAAVAPHARVEAFFACWTRKEAYIKALGTGLSLGLDRFEVSLGPDAPAALLATHHDPAALKRWHLVALAPGEGYAGALAMDGRARVACLQWPAAALL